MSCEHEPAGLEDELMIARRALWQEGNLDHCRHHLGSAFALAPDDPRCHELLAQWLAAGPDLDAVLARKQRSCGDVLVEAQVCLHRGDPAGAVPRVLAAIAHAGNAQLPGWLQQWTRAGRLHARFEGRAIASQLLAIERSAHASQELCAAVDDWLDLVDDQVDWRDASVTVRVRFKRQLGRNEAALSLAERLDARVPGVYTAAAIAACHRDAGDYRRSIAASQLAAERDPHDGFPLLDAGDLALDQLDDYPLAIAAYAEAERRGAKPAWARISRLAAEYLLDPCAARRAAFEAEAATQPEEERVQDLRDRVYEWIGRIHAPREACLNMLRQVELEAGNSLQIGLSSAEAACAHWALQQACAEAGMTLEQTAGAASPDPRAGAPRLAAFRWIGADVEPVRARPAAAPWTGIAALADGAFEPQAWLQQARELRAREGVDTEVLVAMIPFPPEPPRADDDPLWWRRAWAAACAFAIGGGADGWEDLLALVRAPVDWPGEAALIALAAWTLADPARAPHYEALVEECRLRFPDSGDCCLRYAIDAGARYLAERTR